MHTLVCFGKKTRPSIVGPIFCFENLGGQSSVDRIGKGPGREASDVLPTASVKAGHWAREDGSWMS